MEDGYYTMSRRSVEGAQVVQVMRQDNRRQVGKVFMAPMDRSKPGKPWMAESVHQGPSWWTLPEDAVAWVARMDAQQTAPSSRDTRLELVDEAIASCEARAIGTGDAVFGDLSLALKALKEMVEELR